MVAAGAGVEGSDLYALDGDGALIIAGQYGVLTLNADGTYSYQVDPTKLDGLSQTAEPLMQRWPTYHADGRRSDSGHSVTVAGITITGSNEGGTLTYVEE